MGLGIKHRIQSRKKDSSGHGEGNKLGKSSSGKHMVIPKDVMIYEEPCPKDLADLTRENVEPDMSNFVFMSRRVRP